jgi:hypothetical protein
MLLLPQSNSLYSEISSVRQKALPSDNVILDLYNRRIRLNQGIKGFPFLSKADGFEQRRLISDLFVT